MEQGKRSVRFDNELQVEAYCFQGIMQRFPNHFHEYYVIGFIESGRRHLICKNKDYQVRSGALLLFNPSDSHTCEAIDDAPLDYRCINIKRRTMWRVAEEITGKGCLPYFSETVVPDSGLTELLRQLHHMIMEGRKEFDKEELFYFLTEQLIRKYAEPGEGGSSPFIHEEAERVRLYLETHYEEKISLDKLAAMADMNKYSLLRTFTRLYGITPYRYLENIRVNKAKELLEHGGEPLDAAMAAGFSDQSHFTNYFKEFIGLTPGQYRDIFRE
ncbi:AraC family transcriptional regulator [Lacrimispora sp. NSJ-141]|uniref:AraC family transcriptional regulator n=1 Tax=Lientehia hominis TaxID=2897778 RepID=A0AAP2WAF4_9FIRM|nr:AraC family transcriptional regulator [Lientehia hominis]MCD2493104.1 AraC family transcriptional regulator [Lientehia hominis]